MKKNICTPNTRLSCNWLHLILVSFLLVHFSARADVIVPDAEVDLTINKIKACHFLTQATMGPRADEIDALAVRMSQIGVKPAFNEWIDNQFSLPDISHLDDCKDMLLADGIIDGNGWADWDAGKASYPELDEDVENYRYYGWWNQAINGPDQLRQRMAWAMYQIFVANGLHKRTTWTSNMHYYEDLKTNAFGNYRDLLHDITYSPHMGGFLSHAKNDKGDESLNIFPDENYAREIMQLFSIGVYKTNAAGRPVKSNGAFVENYTNEDITELAKVFTGLSPKPRNKQTMGFYTAISANAGIPMIMYEEHHHTGEKNFLGHTIPAGQPGNQDISDALDILFEYQTTPQFIAHRLIQRFTCSTPHTHYVLAVANKFRDNGSGVRGDFKAVLREILMHTSVRDALVIGQTPLSGGNTLITVDVRTSHAQYGILQGRLREPILQMAHFIRFFEPDSYENETASFDGYFKPFKLFKKGMVQNIAAQISVFNYYSADYVPTTGPAANRSRTGNAFALPEFEYLPKFFIELTEGIRTMADNGYVIQKITATAQNAPLVNLLNYSDIDETKSSFEWLINQLNIYMLYGTMSEQLQSDLVVDLDNLTDTTQEERFANALAVLMNSADFAVSN